MKIPLCYPVISSSVICFSYIYCIYISIDVIKVHIDVQSYINHISSKLQIDIVNKVVLFKRKKLKKITSKYTYIDTKHNI